MSGRYHRAAQGWKEHPRVGGRVASLALQWVSDRTSATKTALKSDILRAKVGLAKAWFIRWDTVVDTYCIAKWYPLDHEL